MDRAYGMQWWSVRSSARSGNERTSVRAGGCCDCDREANIRFGLVQLYCVTWMHSSAAVRTAPSHQRWSTRINQSLHIAYNTHKAREIAVPFLLTM